jgi:protein SCO1/2
MLRLAPKKRFQTAASSTIPVTLVVLIALCSSLTLLTTTAVTGCKSSTPSPTAPATTKTFQIRGKIVGVDPATAQIDLDAEAVPGFMEAMVMPYKLADPSILSELHVGDRITADLLADQISTDPQGGFRNTRLTHIVITAQAKPDYKPTVQYHVPATGDQVPNFALLNQSNHLIHLDDLHGKVVLLTFIYTRCQLADFCPRISRNFAQIDRALAASPALYAQTHLVSVSFDPTYDTPRVLKSYGGAYTGQYTHERFQHWDFTAPPIKELPAITQFFDVGVTPDQAHTLTHSMSTVIIGKDGKVLSWYPTNDWSPADLLATVKSAATS